jgi:hypothetical protein
VHRERHDFGAVLAFEIKQIELVDGALDAGAFMVLHDDHGDVVEFHTIRDRDQL